MQPPLGLSPPAGGAAGCGESEAGVHGGPANACSLASPPDPAPSALAAIGQTLADPWVPWRCEELKGRWRDYPHRFPWALSRPERRRCPRSRLGWCRAVLLTLPRAAVLPAVGWSPERGSTCWALMVSPQRGAQWEIPPLLGGVSRVQGSPHAQGGHRASGCGGEGCVLGSRK